MTKEQFRAELKTAFLGGWRAARMGTSAVAWENSIIRTNVDYDGSFERLESASAVCADGWHKGSSIGLDRWRCQVCGLEWDFPEHPSEPTPAINAVDPVDGTSTDGPRAQEDLSSSSSKSTFGVG